MFDFQQKRRLRSFLGSPIIQGFLLVLCVFVGLSAYHRYTVAKEMEVRRQAAEAEVSALLERRAFLEEQVEYLSSERGMEAEMRRQFDVVRDGERVIIILDETGRSEE